ncbi:hypothetical protein V7S43_012958 [Phytophthora oleae]|uniref:Heterokaryon incompatibility domain-containing protein n=1 Tax=Phytophthora oleae TaxID=2107226 RepID=A0ABD3F611_9STRA
METPLSPPEENDTSAVADENQKATSDFERTSDESETVELFNWPPLLPAMSNTTATKSTSLLSHVGGAVGNFLRMGDCERGINEEIKEVIQFLNPVIKPVLTQIKQIAMQPPMTPKDEEHLRRYKTEAQRPQNSSFSRQNGVHLFKLVYDDKVKTKYPYRVCYTSEPIQYNEVIAITYAWHETQEKKMVPLADKRGDPMELGVEWDVEAVLKTLAELSKDNWIWMDQFSLMQNDELTETLSYSIPTIYRSVRVVAFLPYKVCERLFSLIKKFRENDTPEVADALAEFLLHDLVCECTDGIYGWLSRLWTWQELMLATSLQFVWGLGVSQWTRREIFNEKLAPKEQELEEEERSIFSRVLAKAKKEGRKIKKIVKHSLTDLTVYEQPLTKLLNELTKRNTESVIIPKGDSATLSMGYYFCMRLLCGAEIYMPSASRTAPMNCLKVLQQIASTGRKGGRVYDCYYAAAAFIDHPTFLPTKKKTIAVQNQQDKHDDLKDETILRQAYLGLYECEHARLRLPEKFRNVLDDPDRLLQAYTELYIKHNNQSPDLNGEDNAALQHAFVDLYHKAHGTTLVKYTGAPVPNVNCVGNSSDEETDQDDFHPIAWEKNTQSRRNLDKLNSLSEQYLEKRSLLAYLIQADIRGGFLNAFVLSGMHEEAFCETREEDEAFCGSAYNIISIDRIKVGRIQDVWMNSVYKIVANLHPSQLTRVRNFNTIPTDMRLALFPLAHAIIHAASFKIDPFPAHFVKTFSALLGSRTTQDYVDAVTMILGESFDFISDKNGDTPRPQKNQFQLAKIKFSDGTRCVGVISSLMKGFLVETASKETDSTIGKFLFQTFVPPVMHSMEACAVKVVKSHHRLLLCGGILSDWSIVGYIPGFDAEANEAALGPVSHSEVREIKRILVK